MDQVFISTNVCCKFDFKQKNYEFTSKVTTVRYSIQNDNSPCFILNVYNRIF